MALTLPLKFQQSIQSKDTNLIPCVLIGSPNKIIGISTNEIILDNEEYLPLLLNIPSLKESIDLEKRKYKISNLILDISNLEYNGQRFSDIVGKNLFDSHQMVLNTDSGEIQPSGVMFAGSLGFGNTLAANWTKRFLSTNNKVTRTLQWLGQSETMAALGKANLAASLTAFVALG